MPSYSFPPYPLRPRRNGRARIRVGTKFHYLPGAHGSPHSLARYDALRDDWLRNRDLDRSTLTIDELCLKFLDHAEAFYLKDGQQTSEVACIRAAVRPLIKRFGTLLAIEFGPRRLKEVRNDMIAAGLKRKGINNQVHRIKRMFKWAASNEFLDVNVYRALGTVDGLARGRTAAVEGEDVRPVSMAIVDAVQPFVSRQVWAIIQLQLLTGARPGEVLSMRIGEIERQGSLWEYVPRRHKTEHRGKARRIVVGPKAQAVILPFLKADPDAFLFSPADAQDERNEQRRAERKSPMTPSQAVRRAKENGQRRPRDRYTAASYRRAIARACELAFDMPEELRAISTGLKPAARELLVERANVWRKENCWHPHQLRHTAATELRRQYGIEAARIILGHSSLDATGIYAEADLSRARQIALEVG